jgi:Arc/MetJ-type ribon-helix-helix transcriptional regulator
VVGYDTGMTITLKPELETLIQKRLESGIFQNVEEVLWQALESQDAEARWLQLHEREVEEKIDRAIAQAERGEGMSAEQSQAWMEERKTAWRNERRGG